MKNIWKSIMSIKINKYSPSSSLEKTSRNIQMDMWTKNKKKQKVMYIRLYVGVVVLTVLIIMAVNQYSGG
jgi:hypothetical protein